MVNEALRQIGVPILQGAFSTICAVLMAAFIPGYLFRTGFICITLVAILGAIHALIFLPVLLSTFAPPKKREEKNLAAALHGHQNLGMQGSARRHRGPSFSTTEMPAPYLEQAWRNQCYCNGRRLDWGQPGRHIFSERAEEHAESQCHTAQGEKWVPCVADDGEGGLTIRL
jgi:hypothetical protein